MVYQRIADKWLREAGIVPVPGKGGPVELRIDHKGIIVTLLELDGPMPVHAEFFVPIHDHKFRCLPSFSREDFAMDACECGVRTPCQHPGSAANLTPFLP
jgi:hypothetical protein